MEALSTQHYAFSTKKERCSPLPRGCRAVEIKKGSIINVGVRFNEPDPKVIIKELSIEAKSFTMNVPLQHRKGGIYAHDRLYRKAS